MARVGANFVSQIVRNLKDETEVTHVLIISPSSVEESENLRRGFKISLSLKASSTVQVIEGRVIEIRWFELDALDCAYGCVSIYNDKFTRLHGLEIVRHLSILSGCSFSCVVLKTTQINYSV